MTFRNSPTKSTHRFSLLHVLTRSASFNVLKVVLFTALLVASAAGKIVIPGNPVPITLQTFALMVMALSLSPSQSGASVVSYLALGAVGFPVFSGGIAAAALIGPSAGYLYAFVPAVITTAVLKAKWCSAGSQKSSVLRMYSATVIGCVAIPLLVGVPVQSLVTGIPLEATITVSIPFILNDLIKAGVACGIIGVSRFITRQR